MGDQGKAEHISHGLELLDRKTLKVTGVQEVISFQETQVQLITLEGGLTILGQDLHIIEFNLDQGFLSMVGTVSCMDYQVTGRKQNLWKRLFR